MKEREEQLLKKWLIEIGYHEPICYSSSRINFEMEIYTTSPGKLIGKAGVNIEKFKHLLTVEFGGSWTVKLTEIRGGFIRI